MDPVLGTFLGVLVVALAGYAGARLTSAATNRATKAAEAAAAASSKIERDKVDLSVFEASVEELRESQRLLREDLKAEREARIAAERRADAAERRAAAADQRAQAAEQRADDCAARVGVLERAMEAGGVSVPPA